MEEMQIEYNKKLAFFIILGTLVIGWICLGFISIIPIIGALYFIFYYKNPIKFDWIKNSLTIFYLQKQGIKLYPYDKEIPWEDIDTFYIKFAFFRYYLCLKLNKHLHNFLLIYKFFPFTFLISCLITLISFAKSLIIGLYIILYVLKY